MLILKNFFIRHPEVNEIIRRKEDEAEISVLLQFEIIDPNDFIPKGNNDSSKILTTVIETRKN